MSQVHVYGKLLCRGGVETIKGMIDVSDVDTAIAFFARKDAGEDIDDEFDAWMETLHDKYSHDLCALFGGLYDDSFEDGNGARWSNGQTLQVTLEEYEFGVGPTAKEAKLAWVETQE